MGIGITVVYKSLETPVEAVSVNLFAIGRFNREIRTCWNVLWAKMYTESRIGKVSLPAGKEFNIGC